MNAESLHFALIGAFSFAITFAMVPVAKFLAVKFNAIDNPSSRRINTKPIPRMGGIAMYAGVLSALFLQFIGQHFFGWESLLKNSGTLTLNYVGVVAGLSVVTLTGIVDDIFSIKPLTKIFGQMVGAIILVLSGVLLSSIGNPFGHGFINFGLFAYPLTVFYLVAFMNIINLIDGLDGLAGGIVAIAALAIFVIVFGRSRGEAALFAIVLFGATMAFLRYNFHPASIFMGDSGSLFLGAMLGVISLFGSIRSSTAIVLAASVVIAAVPVVDTVAAVVRRISKHRPIQEADTDHLHHKLLRKGYSQVTSVLIMYLWTAFLAFGAIVLSHTSGLLVWVVLGLLAVVSFILVWRLGIMEPVLRHHYNKDTSESSTKK